jgi:hypothetical protein
MVPICESGSPLKDPAAPIDPTAPQVGDTFESLVALIHYIQEYERSRGFTYKKGEQEKDKRGLSAFACSPCHRIDQLPRGRETSASPLLFRTFLYTRSRQQN